MIRRIRIEVVIDDTTGVVSASCCETMSPLRGYWIRWKLSRLIRNRRAITRTGLIGRIRDALSRPLSDNPWSQP